jgi:uncharacterized OB-fold protein
MKADARNSDTTITYLKPLPNEDRDSAPFWQGVREEEFRVQQCARCGCYRWPARAICNRCHSFDCEWVPLSGYGTITSWVTNFQVFMAAYKDCVPYHVIRVQLDEQDDLQVIGQFSGNDTPAEGMRVKAAFCRVTSDATLVFWQSVNQ